MFFYCILAKKVVLLVSRRKNEIHQFWPPWKNFYGYLGKNPLMTPWKKFFRRPCLDLILIMQRILLLLILFEYTYIASTFTESPQC